MTERPLRIAQISPLWTRVPPGTYGGVDLLMKLLIDELVERGHEVTLFATADCATRATLHPVCETNLCDMLSNGSAYVYEYYANGVMADVLLRQKEFDVIHSHLAPSSLPLGALASTPVLWTLHTNIHRDDEWALARYPGVRVAGISESQVHAASMKVGHTFPVVYNGCDFGAYEPDFGPGEYLAYLGRMSPAKNPRDAIRIAEACGMPIVLAGQPQNAQETQYFEAEIKPLLDDERVRWIGPVNHLQKNELLRRASALVFPIQWDEPFGLVMIEAMACGAPVIAHRRGSVAEVVDNGFTGYHSSVIDGMAELVPEALKLDRATVRAHAEKRFGFQAMVDAYERLYREMVDRK